MEFPQSPVNETLQQLAISLQEQANESSSSDEREGIEQVIYLVFKKRFTERDYNPPLQEYLSALIGDVKNAEWEHSEVCYANSAASSAFSAVKLTLVQLLAENT